MVDLSVERLFALEMQKSTASLWVEHDQSEVRGWSAYAVRWHCILDLVSVMSLEASNSG
jgi:hypothetical protein